MDEGGAHGHSHSHHDHYDDEEEEDTHAHAHSHGGCSHGHSHGDEDEHHTHTHSHGTPKQKPNETPKKPSSTASDKSSHQRSTTTRQEYVYDKNGFFAFMNDARTRLWVYSIGSTLIISACPFLILGLIPVQVHSYTQSTYY